MTNMHARAMYRISYTVQLLIAHTYYLCTANIHPVSDELRGVNKRKRGKFNCQLNIFVTSLLMTNTHKRVVFIKLMLYS